MAQPEAHRLQVTVCVEVPVGKITLAPPSTTLCVKRPMALTVVRVSEAIMLRGA